MNITKIFRGFSKKDLEKLPVNYQTLTKIHSTSKIINSSYESYLGIKVHKYNTTLINNYKHYSPISKIIDFE